MQTVPDSSTGAVATERINGVIAETVAAYEAAGETRVKLLDTNSCWDSGCYLSDGVHLTMLGLQKWYEYLAANLGPQCSPGAELSSGQPRRPAPRQGRAPRRVPRAVLVRGLPPGALRRKKSNNADGPQGRPLFSFSARDDIRHFFTYRLFDIRSKRVDLCKQKNFDFGKLCIAISESLC